MIFLTDLGFLLHCLLRAVFDALLGRKRRRYRASTLVNAPKDIVWKTVAARELVIDDMIPLVISVAPRAGSPDIIEGTIRRGDMVFPLAYREIAERPGEANVIEILREGSDPRIAQGEDYFVHCTLVDAAQGTYLTVEHELTHTGFAGRIAVPLGARLNARRLKRHCEKLAGVAMQATSRVGAAITTGALTFASFMYMFDFAAAASLVGLIFIHEAGHAIAMRWVGQPVEGIYFIPFVGGVAVGAAPHKSEAERGFVALMGPGFSIAVTAAFLIGWQITGNEMLAELAMVSALLNGLNLAPVLPLDGGQVVDSLLSGLDAELRRLVNLTGLILGVGATLYFEWHIMTAMMVLGAPLALRVPDTSQSTIMAPSARIWLATGYLGTIAFYAAVASEFLA